MYNLMILMKRAKQDQSGQALALLAMMLMMFFAFICVTINVGHFAAQRVTAQSGADADAMSGAVWMARALNTIQVLNQIKQIGILHCWMEGIEVTMHILHLAVAAAEACAACTIGCLICVLVDPCVWEEAWHVFKSYRDLNNEIKSTKKEMKQLTDIQKELNKKLTLYAAIIAGSTYSANQNTPGSIIHVPFVDDMDKPMALKYTADSQFISVLVGIDWLVSTVLSKLFGLSLSNQTLTWDWCVLESNYDKKTYVIDVKSTSAKGPALWGELFGKPDCLLSNLFLNIAHARPFKNESYTVTSGLSAQKPGLAQIFSWPPSFLKETKWDVKMNRVVFQGNYYSYATKIPFLSTISGVGSSLGASNLLIRH